MPSSDLARRAVVTGLGAVTPIGNDAPTYWSNLLAGVPGGGPITTFDTTNHDVKIAAAVEDAGLDFATWTPEERDRAAVVINTGGGGMEQVIDGAYTIQSRGPGQVSPFAIPALSGSMGAAQVSMKYGITGPVITQVAACASGVLAFQDALRLIRSG